MLIKNKVARVLALSVGLILATSLTSVSHAKRFKVAVGDGGGSAQDALAKKFKEEFESRSGGKHKIKLFINGQLGSEQDTVNEAAIGTLDFSVLAINNLTPFSPTVGVFTLPYLIQSLEEAEQLTQGPVGEELVANTIRDAGVRIVGWTYTGFRVLTNSKRPIKTLADLKGMVIRVPKNEIMIDAYKSWGINPTPMAWSETFTALQQKVVDGQDNPYLTIYSMKFDEVQKYVTNIRYLFSIEPIIVSETIFQDQDAKTQKVILESGKAATLYSAQFLRDSEAKIKKVLVERGMQIDDPANGEKAWIKKATEGVWPKYYESIGGKDKLNKVLKMLGRDGV
jgi:tripartite ATP-independent transporter DctP family solute receptor